MRVWLKPSPNSRLASVLSVDAALFFRRIGKWRAVCLSKNCYMGKDAVEVPKPFQKIDLYGVEAAVLSAAKSLLPVSRLEANYELFAQG